MTKTTFSVILPPPADPDEERKEQRSALLSIWVFTGDNREEHMLEVAIDALTRVIPENEGEDKW